MKKLYIIICIAVFISCKEKPKGITRLEYLNNLRSEVIYKGVTNSFYALFIDNFHDSDVREELNYYHMQLWCPIKRIML